MQAAGLFSPGMLKQRKRRESSRGCVKQRVEKLSLLDNSEDAKSNKCGSAATESTSLSSGEDQEIAPTIPASSAISASISASTSTSTYTYTPPCCEINIHNSASTHTTTSEDSSSLHSKSKNKSSSKSSSSSKSKRTSSSSKLGSSVHSKSSTLSSSSTKRSTKRKSSKSNSLELEESIHLVESTPPLLLEADDEVSIPPPPPSSRDDDEGSIVLEFGESSFGASFGGASFLQDTTGTASAADSCCSDAEEEEEEDEEDDTLTAVLERFHAPKDATNISFEKLNGSSHHVRSLPSKKGKKSSSLSLRKSSSNSAEALLGKSAHGLSYEPPSAPRMEDILGKSSHGMFYQQEDEVTEETLKYEYGYGKAEPDKKNRLSRRRLKKKYDETEEEGMEGTLELKDNDSNHSSSKCRSHGEGRSAPQRTKSDPRRNSRGKALGSRSNEPQRGLLERSVSDIGFRRSSLKTKGTPRRSSIQCRGERTIYLPCKNSPVKKRTSIQFDKHVVVSAVTPVTELVSHEYLWYQQDDFEQTMEDSQRLVASCEGGDEQQQLEEKDIRGLEKLSKPKADAIWLQRYDAWDSVLLEQAQQREEGIFQQDYIAQRYQESVKVNQQEAQERALRDAADIEQYLEPTRDEIRRTHSLGALRGYG